MEVGIVNWLSLDDHDFTKAYENLWSLLQSEQVRKAQLGAMDANLRPCKGKKAFDGDFSYWELGKKEEKLEQLFSGSGPYPTMVSLFRPDYIWTPNGDDGDDTMYQYLMIFDEGKSLRYWKFDGEYFQSKKRANYNDEVKMRWVRYNLSEGSRLVSWTVTPALVLDVEDEDCVLGPAHFGMTLGLSSGSIQSGVLAGTQMRSLIYEYVDGEDGDMKNRSAVELTLYEYVEKVAQFLGLKPTDIGIMGTELIWFVVLNESFNEGWMDFLREKCPKGWARYREQCLEWWSSQQKGYALQSPIPKWAWSNP